MLDSTAPAPAPVADATPPDLAPYWSLRQTAERIDRPVATLRYWRHMRIGPKSAKLGGRVVYRPADVAAWVNAAFDADDLPSDAA
jgi:hypothetical protein